MITMPTAVPLAPARRAARWLPLLLQPIGLLLLIGSLAGCMPRLVQPHDEALVTATEALYAEAAEMIDDGIAASPRTDAERDAFRPSTRSDGHYSRYEPRYDKLIRASDLMILRAMAGSDGVDRLGQTLQAKIEAAIDNAVPSVCAELTDSFNELGATSLTVRNQVDLKCLLTRWKEQHADPALTRNSLILKRANWETRRASLFRVVLAIQRAQLSNAP